MAETPLMRMIDEGVVDADDIFTPEVGLLAAQSGAMMMPGSGILDAAGYAFDMPSIGENIYQGNFGDAALQGAGLLGDMMYAAAPFTAGLSVPPAIMLKTASATKAAKKLTKADKDPMGYSSVMLDKPISEVEFDIEPISLLGERAVVSPEYLEDTILLFGPGDRSGTGLLTSLEGQKFDEPVLGLGGRNYQLATPYAWASNESVVTDILNRARKAQQETGIENVVLAHSTMAPQTIDFTEMNSSAVAEMLKESPILKADAKEFDDMVNELFDPKKLVGGKFPGVKSDKFREWMASQSGETRKAIIRMMDTKIRRDQNFPMVGKARFAFTEPAQRDVPTFQTGLSFIPIDVARGAIKDPSIPHASYNTAIGRAGEPVQLKGTVDTSEVYRDFFKTLESAVDRYGRPQKMSQKQYTTRLSMPYQVMDAQLVDYLSGLLDY